MSMPGPGWYTDPSNGHALRWWSGTEWSDLPSPSTSPRPRNEPAKQKLIIAAIVAAAVLLIVTVSGVLAQFLVSLGIVAAGIGVYAAAVGSAKVFRVRSRKVGVLVLTAGLFVTMVGGAAGAATVGPDQNVAAVSAPAASESPKPPTPRATRTPTPVVTQTEVRESVVIPFESTSVNDASMAAGTTAVTTAGTNGEKAIVYVVTMTDGVETGRQILREEITVQPVTQVTSIGTKQAVVVPPPAPAPPSGGGCHSSYSGVCVPTASDVDCAGGSGNGPEYVTGPLNVVGPDVYDLDRDGDGIACD